MNVGFDSDASSSGQGFPLADTNKMAYVLRQAREEQLLF